MVTVAFIAVFSGILLLISGIDVFMYKQPFLTSLSKLFMHDSGTNEGYINAALGIGFILSIAVDFRLRKNKRSKQS